MSVTDTLFFYRYMDTFSHKILQAVALTLFILACCGCSTKQSEYSFSGKELCNGPNGPIRYLELDTFQRYGANKPFNIKRTETSESIDVSFKVIQDCCQEPVQNLQVSDSEITVGYSFKGKTCDCVCDYLFSYSFDKDFVSNKIIVVK